MIMYKVEIIFPNSKITNLKQESTCYIITFTQIAQEI